MALTRCLSPRTAMGTDLNRRTRRVGWIGMAVAVACLTACTDMPPVKTYLPTGQTKLSSAQHWMLIAKDVATTVYETRDGADCIQFKPPEHGPETQFQQVLAVAVRKEILDRDNSLQPIKIEVKDPVKDSPQPLGIYEYEAESSPKCDWVAIDGIVIRHKGVAGEPYPGKYTLLAQGLVVIRNVARAFSSASAVGAVALGEGAFWASSGFRTGDASTEIVITTSRTDSRGRYVAQYTDVYYINSGDVGLYETSNRSTSAEAAVADDQADDGVAQESRVVKESQPAQGSDSPHEPESAAEPESAKEPDYRRELDKAAREAERTAAKAAAAIAAKRPCTNGFLDECLRPRHLRVWPSTVSMCDSTAEFVVYGQHLAHSPSRFQLGTLKASQLETAGRDANFPADTEAVQVMFEGLQKANKGLDDVTLSMAGDDGVASVGHVYFDSSCTAKKTAARTVPTDKTTGKPTVAKPGADQTALIVPQGGTADKPYTSCSLPLTLSVAGPGAGLVSKATTVDGNFVGVVKTTTVNGGRSTTTLSFAKLLDLKSFATQTRVLRVQLTLTNKKTVTQDFYIKCAK
jgi:hypothetical protein